MSGLEILGIAANIIQIADLGARVALKLCTFCHKAKQAEANIQALSKDVSLTSSVLRQLGDNLKQDDQAKLYSPSAFDTAHEVLKECEKVFRQIELAMDKDSAISAVNAPGENRNLILKLTRKVNYAFKEPQLELLQTNLDRLKNTMLLMLNVIIYAGQLRKRQAGSATRDQQELVRILEQQRIESNQKFERLTKALEGIEVGGDDDEEKSPTRNSQSSRSMTAKPETVMATARALPSTNSSFSPQLSTNFVQLPPQHPVVTEPQDEDNQYYILQTELSNYTRLVETMLVNIVKANSRLAEDRHRRIHQTVLDMHHQERQHFVHDHGTRAEYYCSLLWSKPIFAPVERLQNTFDAVMENEKEGGGAQQHKLPTSVKFNVAKWHFGDSNDNNNASPDSVVAKPPKRGSSPNLSESLTANLRRMKAEEELQKQYQEQQKMKQRYSQQAAVEQGFGGEPLPLPPELAPPAASSSTNLPHLQANDGNELLTMPAPPKFPISEAHFSNSNDNNNASPDSVVDKSKYPPLGKRRAASSPLKKAELVRQHRDQQKMIHKQYKEQLKMIQTHPQQASVQQGSGILPPTPNSKRRSLKLTDSHHVTSSSRTPHLQVNGEQYHYHDQQDEQEPEIIRLPTPERYKSSTNSPSESSSSANAANAAAATTASSGTFYPMEIDDEQQQQSKPTYLRPAVGDFFDAPTQPSARSRSRSETAPSWNPNGGQQSQPYMAPPLDTRVQGGHKAYSGQGGYSVSYSSAGYAYQGGPHSNPNDDQQSQPYMGQAGYPIYAAPLPQAALPAASSSSTSHLEEKSKLPPSRRRYRPTLIPYQPNSFRSPASSTTSTKIMRESVAQLKRQQDTLDEKEQQQQIPPPSHSMTEEAYKVPEEYLFYPPLQASAFSQDSIVVEGGSNEPLSSQEICRMQDEEYLNYGHTIQKHLFFEAEESAPAAASGGIRLWRPTELTRSRSKAEPAGGLERPQKRRRVDRMLSEESEEKESTFDKPFNVNSLLLSWTTLTVDELSVE